MGEGILKPGWTLVKFGEVVRQVKDRVDPQTAGLTRYIAGEHMDTDDLRIRRWGDIGDDYLGPAFNMRFKPGQVLYGSRRTYLRKVAVPDFEGICANTTFVLEPRDSNILLPELLPFIMQTEAFHDHSIKQSKGSVNPYINFSDLAWYEFALPLLDEQHRLVSLFKSTEDVLRTYHDCYASVTELLKSAMENLLDPIRRKWNIARIGELCEISSGGTPRREKTEYWNGTIPWVKTGEVNYSLIINTEEKITEEGMQNSSAKLMPVGSIVMALFGQGPTLGRVSMLGIDATTNQACAVIMPNPNMDMKFLYYFLWRQYHRIRAMARGATQPNLNVALVKSLKVPVISLQEQVYWVEQFDKIVSSKESIRQREVAATKYKHNLLSLFFED